MKTVLVFPMYEAAGVEGGGGVEGVEGGGVEGVEGGGVEGAEGGGSDSLL